VTDSLAAARDAVAAARSVAGRRIVLGLAGPPGAGKSTLAEFIVGYARSAMGESWAACFPMDGYHLSNAQLDRLGLRDRKGAPCTFDVGGYLAMLSRIAADSGDDCYVPEFDRCLDEPVAARLLVPAAARLIVTEGNYLALDAPRWREARRFIDHLWYVDAPDPVREERLVARQLACGKPEAAARAWVERSDRSNGELVKPTRGGTDRTITPLC
jgi:pantothenate kinase